MAAGYVIFAEGNIVGVNTAASCILNAMDGMMEWIPALTTEITIRNSEELAPDERVAAVKLCLRRGAKVSAIKLVREVFPANLADVKELVERMDTEFDPEA